jgi:hypothetical protein
MMRDEYVTDVPPLTLSGSEGHYPVIADLRLHRATLNSAISEDSFLVSNFKSSLISV